jgi:hypothetical protein
MLRQLAARAARHSLQHLRDYVPRKRHGIMVAYLLHNHARFIDELVEMFTRLVGRWFNKANRQAGDHFPEQQPVSTRSCTTLFSWEPR